MSKKRKDIKGTYRAPNKKNAEVRQSQHAVKAKKKQMKLPFI